MSMTSLFFRALLVAALVTPLASSAVAQTPLGGGAIPPSPELAAKAERLVREVLEPELELDLDPRRSKIIRTRRPVARFSITNPSVMDVVQFSPTEFELIGLNSGQTSLSLWFDGGQPGEGELLRYLVRVSPNEAIEDRRKIEYGDLETKLRELFPGSMVQLIPVADKLIVRGQARDAEEATNIMSIIRSQEVSGAAGNAAVQVNQGNAATPFPGTDQLPQSSVINMLEVPGESQVMLKVRIAELSRSALREAGADFAMEFGDFSLTSALTTGSPFSAVIDSTEVQFTLEALSTNGYAKILAEPNLVTLSGHPASFIAGGEFAVPVVVGVEGAAAATTNFRGFGTQLVFIPTVLDKDRIRLQVAPSFSSLNEDNAVDGIPGLDTRAVATTVDLREGQWLAIAGLLQDEQSGTKVRVPFFGDIPYVGAGLSNRDARRDESELIVLVSPELVHPLEAEEAPLILPGMEVTEPTDWGFYLKGRYEGKVDCHHRSTVWPVLKQQAYDARCDAKRQSRYQQSECYFIQGDFGFSP